MTKQTFKPYDHQKEIVEQALPILRKNRLVYLACEARVGKTISALMLCNEMKYKRVLFATKKDAINGTKADMELCQFPFELTVINHESLHKVKDSSSFDCVIIDEAHKLGGYKTFKQGVTSSKAQKVAKGKDVIFMSGTPAPESALQLYNQLKASSYSPFKAYDDFNKFLRKYGDTELVPTGFNRTRKTPVTYYPERIINQVRPLMVTCSRKEAGLIDDFKVTEEIIEVEMRAPTKILLERLRNKEEKISFKVKGEPVSFRVKTPAEARQKRVQVASGTLKVNDETSLILDPSKAIEIKKRSEKMESFVIFYQYQKELEMLREVFPDHTQEAGEFQAGDYPVMLAQFQRHCEGVDLSRADGIFFLTVVDSSATVLQARSRLFKRTRTKDIPIFWVVDSGVNSVGREIYKRVRAKDSNTNQYLESKKAV